jgi:hypothetical protein
VKTKAREFHGHDALLAGRESPCRDNTIEGNVGVWLSRFRGSLGCDNGEAAAEGQPPPRAFPKAFRELLAGFFGALCRGFDEAFYPKLFERFRPGRIERDRISSSAAV